jgi:hypothetical protein
VAPPQDPAGAVSLESVLLSTVLPRDGYNSILNSVNFDVQAVEQFAKEIGAPDAIICDMAGEQTSRELKRCCQEIGTTLRVLEEGTPWANKTKLYIGLIKEAVRKDMKDSYDCPLAFWDFCVERRARINNLTAKDIFKLHGTNAHTALTGEDGDRSRTCVNTSGMTGAISQSAFPL